MWHWIFAIKAMWLLLALVETKSENKRKRLPVSDEKKLVNRLLSDYRRLGIIGRPVSNQTTTVNVEFGLGLISMAIEEKDNMLMMSAWTRYKWTDEYLQWDPSDYGAVTSIKIPHSRIWTPDIMLYNTASTELLTRSALLVVTFEGTVMWYPHRIFHSSCSINVRNFPFDNQTCYMYFGSWTHSMAELNLSLAFETGIDLSTFDSDFNSSSKWHIRSVSAERHVIDQYSVLSFTMSLKRKMMFSSYILTVPAVFLSFLTLVVFALPAEDVEKSQLGLAIFGSLLLLLLIVVEAAPPTASAVPLLGVFYCFTTVIVILSVFLTAVVIKLGNASKSGKFKPVPRWIKLIFFRGLGRMLCVALPSTRRRRTMRCDSETGCLPNGNIQSTDKILLMSEQSRGGDLRASQNAAVQQLQELLRQIHHTLQTISTRQFSKIDKEEDEKDIDIEWKHLASILDRFFFWLYFISITVSIILLFPAM